MPGAAKASNTKLLDAGLLGCLDAWRLGCLIAWLLDASTIITRALLLLTIMIDAYLVDL